MKIQLSKQTTLDELASMLKKAFPQYEVNKRSSLFFEYVQVRETAFVGASVRIKNDTIFVSPEIPSFAVRLLLGGLLLFIFIGKRLDRVVKEVGTCISTRMSR